jgi:hypothetical protein
MYLNTMHAKATTGTKPIRSRKLNKIRNKIRYLHEAPQSSTLFEYSSLFCEAGLVYSEKTTKNTPADNIIR